MRLKKAHEAVEEFDRTRVDALLQHATGREELELFASSGATLLSLAARVAGEPDPTDADWSPDPGVLARVVRRISLRTEHQLPHRECILENPEPEARSCQCLAEVLDSQETGTLTRSGVVKAAKRLHRETWAWLKTKPPPRPERVSRPETPKLVRHQSRSRSAPQRQRRGGTSMSASAGAVGTTATAES